MKKFAIIYGTLENEIQKRAVEELTKILTEHTQEYPVCIKYGSCEDTSTFRCIYLGSKENNAYIKKHSDTALINEGYSITVHDDTVIIEGADDAGTLYGALDFYNEYVIKYSFDEVKECCANPFISDAMPDFEYCSAPSIKERGLWTWGHVIYDYRGYLDNMMRLKLNRIVIWNDYPPANAREIVAYAHSRNIKVIFGFPWLWDTDCSKFDIKDIDGYSEKIFCQYEREYARIGADGIYFQTFTELTVDRIGEVLIADAATRFVNRTVSLFFEKYPELEIEFGLHATSVKERLDLIGGVDPRVRIVWEDCGAFPFSYLPTKLTVFDETKSFIEKASHLRGKYERFGAVTKGLVKLDWSKFEHAQGTQYIGVSTNAFKSRRIERKASTWRFIQAGWLANGDKAYEMVKYIHELTAGNTYVLALVEDGVFEENVMYPVALYSQMLWDCRSDIKELLSKVAMRNYVVFA